MKWITRERVKVDRVACSWLIKKFVDKDFFFQAEDGIRDGRVTGVQTCALPISSGSLVAASLRRGAPARAAGAPAPAGRRRSEERRVGKEWRSRGWPYH